MESSKLTNDQLFAKLHAEALAKRKLGIITTVGQLMNQYRESAVYPIKGKLIGEL